MTKHELRVFFQEWFCGCGIPERGAAFVHKVLSLAPFYQHRGELEALFHKDDGLEYVTLCTLDKFDLIEHGGGIGGSWLTEKGKAVLAALEIEKADGFESLMAQSCMHGYAVDTDELLDCPECGPHNRELQAAPSLKGGR